MRDLDALERVIEVLEADECAKRPLRAALAELRASHKVVEAAREVDAAYPDEFGPQVWEEEMDYPWKRAMKAQHSALAELEALK